MSKYVPSLPDYKILETIFLLNEDSIYPLNEGVVKILNGIEDPETTKYVNFATFGSIKSYSSKKISRHITMLLRYKYLTKKYDPNTKKLYLAITNIGVNSLSEFKKTHKNAFAIRESKTHPSFVKIDE